MMERYLCFSLDKEEFAVPLTSVREVLAQPEITPLAFVPSHYIGVINLRGEIITVLDLRRKLGIPIDPDAESTIIVCHIGTYTVGVVVSSVNRVLLADTEQLSSYTDSHGSHHADYVLQVLQDQGHLTLFIDLAIALNFRKEKLAC